jgi:Skp family chaperone for outer membrane proteins
VFLLFAPHGELLPSGIACICIEKTIFLINLNLKIPMKKIKIITSLILLSLFVIQCKPEAEAINFKKLTENYFDDKNALSPLDATVNGQNQYNDQLVFEMTDSYRKKQAEFFDKYESELAKVDTRNCF